MIPSADIEHFWRPYKVNFALSRDLKLRAEAATAEIVHNHAENFWFSVSAVTTMNVLFHNILDLGLYLRLRFDDFTKIHRDHVSVSKPSLSLWPITATKNYTLERVYGICAWEGNAALKYSIYMEPLIALCSWLVIRGNEMDFCVRI